ncbi:ABC transporter ATP-binding protein [Hoeflea sp.]|uniref:ABC transporter ATP-binding protein n=1 Tax=Hoeflea sp. TaxID=1940281 RepID=UPI003B5251A6
MSCEVSLWARGLQKKYELHDNGFGALVGLMTGRVASRHHWAIRDFDLDARAGDFIGIVGRNGAGKSTLLQIIAGIMPPDSGELTVNGRVAALLELETGFSPDFTGWENVELSAALYGLSSRQIEGRRAAISDFAGLGSYMDRPTRQYSSGMRAKLAFSVCLHVDADIVIVDELFGVGDYRFRQRATERLRQFSERGIVFFVSHSETTVLSLCNRAIFIEGGKKLGDGATKPVFRAYQRTMSRLGGETGMFRESGSATDQIAPAPENQPADRDPPAAPLPSGVDFYKRARPDPAASAGLIDRVELGAADGPPERVYEGGELLVLTVHTDAIDLSDVFVAILLRDGFGQIICARDTLELGDDPASGRGEQVFGAEFEFPLPYLPSGDYGFDVAIGRKDLPGEWLDYLEAAADLAIVSRHISDGLANVAMDEVVITTTVEP